jgi:hypothetical protein
VKTFVRIILVACASFAMFLVGLLGTFWVSYAIYGEKKVNDTVSGYAILVVGVFVGIALGIAGIPLSIILSRRIKWFTTQS